MPTSPSNTSHSPSRSTPPPTPPTPPPGEPQVPHGGGVAAAASRLVVHPAGDEQLAAISRRRPRTDAASSAASGGATQRRRLEAAEAGPSQPAGATRPRHESMALPQSLSDLPAWRQPLLDAPAGSLTRQFGERLQDLQQSLASHRIDRPTFEALAGQIVEDLATHETELTYWDHHLANGDVSLQHRRLPEAGSAFFRPPLANGRAAHLTLSEALESLTNAMRRGRSAGAAVEQSREQHGLTHEADIRELNDIARLLSTSGGARAPAHVLLDAHAELTAVLDGGGPPEQAVQQVAQRHGITNMLDLNVLRRHATERPLVMLAESDVAPSA